MPWCILDDFFPNLLTGFRVAEYNAYMQASEELRIYSSYGKFPAVHAEYAAVYPQFASRVQRIVPAEIGRYRFVYMNFLNNANLFLPIIEHFGIPFVLTMYPGGGFGLNEPPSDEKLARITASKWLRCIITTQRVTEEYISQRHPHVPLKPIYGGVFSGSYFTPEHIEATAKRPRYGYGKQTLDICFVADNYMPQGINKGYPQYVLAAAQIADRLPQARFHVVGGFGPADFPVTVPSEQWQFHGHVYTDQLRAMLLDMDLIVSPNMPFKLHAGNFDGFPTGSCVEASLCGVAMMVTDPLNLNQHYVDGESIIFIPPEPNHIAERILDVVAHPARLADMGRRGCEISRDAFAPQRQMEDRIRVLVAAAADVGVDLGLRSI